MCYDPAMTEKPLTFPEQERLQIKAALDQAIAREDWQEVMDCAARLAAIDASEAARGVSKGR